MLLYSVASRSFQQDRFKTLCHLSRRTNYTADNWSSSRGWGSAQNTSLVYLGRKMQEVLLDFSSLAIMNRLFSLVKKDWQEMEREGVRI